MTIKCPQCGAEYDATVFTFGRRIRCGCGAWVDDAVGHQQTSEDGRQAGSSPGSRQDASTISDNPFAPVTRAHRGILWLVVAHVVVGMVAAFVASTDDKFPPSLPPAVLLGVVFSQTSLLGIWGSLGTTPWQTRLIGVLLCVGYLAPLLGIGIHDVSIETFTVVVMATLFVVLPLLIVRHFRVAIHRGSSRVAPPGGLQFSIRHLMILTFVIACLISIGRLMQPRLFPHGRMSFLLFLIAFTFAAVGVLPAWFVLATKRPFVFSIGSLAIAACAGYCLGQGLYGGEGIWMMTVTATEAVAVVLSLLVVRFCGYRLARLPQGRQTEKLVS